MAFRSHFMPKRSGRKFPIVHFRSIFEGHPIARHKSQHGGKLVFEVNGLPSIELKYHYPAVADDRDLIEKLITQEQICIEAADLLVTVSEVTANHLISRGADPARIRVIPNGVDLTIFQYQCQVSFLRQHSPPLSASRECTLASSGKADRAGERPCSTSPGWSRHAHFDRLRLAGSQGGSSSSYRLDSLPWAIAFASSIPFHSTHWPPCITNMTSLYLHCSATTATSCKGAVPSRSWC